MHPHKRFPNSVAKRLSSTHNLSVRVQTDRLLFVLPHATPHCQRVSSPRGCCQYCSLRISLAHSCAAIYFPISTPHNKMEMLADKVGALCGILIATLFLRRCLLRSFRLALICLAATEVVVLVIILHFTGLTTLTLFDIGFNVGWLYSLTWNVVVAYILGAVFGHLWQRGS